MRALVDLTRRLNVQTVVDLGCGEGLVLRQLSLLWNKDRVEVHGVDIGTELLQVARQIAPSIVYLTGSIYQLPLPDQYYDLVVCTEVLEHLENPEAALAEIVRVGKGYCLLSVPYEPWWRMTNVMRGSYVADLGNTPGHVNHWSRQTFIQFVNGYLDVESVRQPFPWIMVLGRVHSRAQQ